MDNFTEFKEELKSELSDVLMGRGHDVEITDTIAHKANQDLEGITVRLDGSNVSPTLYTESIYEDYKDSGITIREMSKRIADTVEKAYDNFMAFDFDAKDFNSDYIRDHSYIAVVNTEMNHDLLSRLPHEEIPGTDLSAFAKVHIGANASITITNEHAFQMGMTGTEILESARDNTLRQDFTVQSMQETLSSIMPDADGLFPMAEEEKPNMVVITNEAKYDGAQAIISSWTLDKACAKMGCDSAVIIPSSRHELLAVNPNNLDFGSTSDIKQMVEEVNASQVSVEDKLSDNIYKYDSHTHELTLCDEDGLFPEHDMIASFDTSMSTGVGIAM